MRNVFITSDYHIGHKNILTLTDRWKYCDSIKEHDELIISRHNSIVDKKDIVYDLGDFSFTGSVDYTVEVLQRLNGKRVMLWGNHDTNLRKAFNRGMLDSMINSGKLQLIGPSDKSMHTTLTINHNKQKYHLSHYSFRSWPGAFHGAIHLYGHSHNNLPGIYNSMDVGVDTSNLYPWNIEDIKKIMDNKNTQFSER